jgi:hypothetical protein
MRGPAGIGLLKRDAERQVISVELKIQTINSVILVLGINNDLRNSLPIQCQGVSSEESKNDFTCLL